MLPSKHTYYSSLFINPFYLFYNTGYSLIIIFYVSLSSSSSTVITIGLGRTLLAGGGESLFLPFPLPFYSSY